MAGEDRRDVFVNAAVRMGSYDLVIILPLIGMWSLFGVMNFAVGLALSGLRALVWLAHLRSLLAPVRECEAAGEEGRDEQIRAADEVLQRLGVRFGVPYGIGWVVVFGLAVALARTGIASERAVPDVELMISSMILLALLLSLTDSVPSVLGDALIDARTRVSTALFERGIVPRRPRRSIRRSVARQRSTQVMAILLALGGIGGLVHAHGMRTAALMEGRKQVEVSAVRIETETGPALEGVEIVNEDALAESLLAERDDHDDDAASIAVFDRARDRVFAAAPLADGRWAFTELDPDEQLEWMALTVLVLALGAALPSGIGGAAYGRSLVAPIEQLDEATRGFVERGELRALARIVPLEDDEIGRLAVNFNDMLDMLEKLALAADAVAAGDLGVDLEHPGELHDAFRSMLSRLSETVVRLRETSLELASAAAEIHALTLQQDDAGQEQSASVQQVSATVASLADSAQNIANTAKGALVDAEQAVATTDAMVEKIAELRSQAASVTELLEAIREIAKRSDLLALNGSLEATRAGEAGRGFALVAAEMRRLAERVTGTVNDVRERVAAIEASGVATVMATEEGRRLAERASEAARAISGVTERQSADMVQVADGVKSVATMVSAAALATSQARAAAEGLREHAAALELLTGEFRVPDNHEGPGSSPSSAPH